MWWIDFGLQRWMKVSRWGQTDASECEDRKHQMLMVCSDDTWSNTLMVPLERCDDLRADIDDNMITLQESRYFASIAETWR